MRIFFQPQALVRMLQTLLVPTDFSPASVNSLHYAVQLMCQLKIEKLVVLHAYHIPVSTVETAYMADQALMLEQAEQLASTEMARLEKELLQPAGVQYECVNHIGPALEEINQLVEDKNIDLVVMASHKMSKLERLFGSLTTHAIEDCKVPVLVVPENYSFAPLRHILYTTDLKHIPYQKTLAPVHYLSKAFDARITLLNVNPDYNHLAEEEVKELQTLQQELANEQVRLAFSEEKGREDAILRYIEENAVDLLMVVPHHHNFFDELFRSSLSKKLALHSSVPLLALHA